MYKQLIYIVVLAIFLSACAGKTLKEVPDACAAIQANTERFKCYRADINSQIRSQLESDYRDYEQDALTSGDAASRLVLQGVTVDITLSPDGRVERVSFLDTSRNTFFDNMVERAIQNAGPFVLPDDPGMKKALLQFRFSIILE